MYYQQYQPTQSPTQYQYQPTQNPPQYQQYQQTAGAFVQVPTEQEAYNWAVAPGHSISFKVQGQPLIIEKTMGFSQFESPKIKRYRMVEEEVTQQELKPEYVQRSDLADLESKLSGMRQELDEIKVKFTQEVKADEV